LIASQEVAEMVATRQWSPQATKRLLRAKETPLLIMDRGVLEQSYDELRRELPDADIHYALKANPDRSLAEFLSVLGAGFEISSEGELDLLLKLGIPRNKIITSNPVKPPGFIKKAHSAGVNLFAFDSLSELKKLATDAPGSRVCLRLSVSNEGSEWPLSRKFGVETEQAIELLVQAEGMGLEPAGITFHVGSQCTNPDSWVKAIEKSRYVWEAVGRKGITLRVLNLGGGFPIRYTKPVPPAGDIASAIKNAVRSMFPEGVELLVEPGRVLVGEAGILVTTVIGKAERDGQKWLYLDVGVFNGLMESIGGIRYPMAAARNGATTPWVLAGPSCDSFDTIASDVILPELEIGDILYIMSAGAYTTAYASHFNGFPVPRTLLV